MKKMLTALSIAVLLPTLAIASEGKFEGKRDHMRDMAKDLNLSDEQRSEIRDIMKKHMEATRLEIRNVLDDEQRAKFDAKHEERMQKMEERKAKREERKAERDSDE